MEDEVIVRFMAELAGRLKEEVPTAASIRVSESWPGGVLVDISGVAGEHLRHLIMEPENTSTNDTVSFMVRFCRQNLRVVP